MGIHTYLHDPFTTYSTPQTARETSALLDLLEVDQLVDSKAGPPKEEALINDLLEVDLEIELSNKRREDNESKDVFIELLNVDLEIDGLFQPTLCQPSSEAPHYACSKQLHDPYAKRQIYAVHTTGTIYANPKKSEEQTLRDDTIMMHLLANDETVDGTKRFSKLVESDEYAMIGELHRVDQLVGGCKQRQANVADYQELLDVDILVDNHQLDLYCKYEMDSTRS